MRGVTIRHWTHSKILKYIRHRKYIFDGPDICFSPSLKYSLHIFAATKLYGGGYGNHLFLTGPLQPWQTLTFQSQNFTIVIRISLQGTSRIAFIKLLRGLIFRKKYFQFDGSFVRNIFQKYLKFARQKSF